MTMGRFTGGRLFPKGVSGNPGGRPKGNPEVKEILKAHSVEAANVMVGFLQSDNEKLRFMAAQEILNRTEGKPIESVKMDVSGRLNLRSQLRDIFKEHIKHEEPSTESESGDTGATKQAGN